jgi:hypothetical protein
MPNSFLLNYLRTLDGASDAMLPMISPEICHLLSLPSISGGEILYLLTSRYNVNLLKHVVDGLHGLYRIHPTHWDHIVQKKLFSNKCVVTGEAIDDIRGFLYVSNQKRYVDYLSYRGLQELFACKDIKCPKTGTLINWYLPLFVLGDALTKLVSTDSSAANQLDTEEASEVALTLKCGNDALSKDFLKALRQYKIRSTIPRYAYSFNSIFEERAIPIFIRLCLIYDFAPLLGQWSKRPEDCILLRQLFLKHNNCQLHRDTLLVSLHEQINAEDFLAHLSAGDQGFAWLQTLLTQSVNNAERIILENRIKNHPSNHTHQMQDEEQDKKRKLTLSEFKTSFYTHEVHRQQPKAKHIRFSDEEEKIIVGP